MIRIAVLASSLLLAGCNAGFGSLTGQADAPAAVAATVAPDPAVANANTNVPELDCRPGRGSGSEILC